MKIKSSYLKFIKWEKDNALFREANILDLLIYGIGLNILLRILNMKERNIILIKCKFLSDKQNEM